jgi:hypothetical protein
LSFVGHDILGVPAKIDTGAYHSAVHATHIKLSTDGKTLSFTLLGGHPVCDAFTADIKTKTFSKTRVTNSFGGEEMRYEVKLRVKLGPKVVTSPFTLTDRSKKVYPILIGRKMLNGRYVVDTAHSSVNRAELKKKYSIVFPVDEEGGREG